jgi:hypothetical protein
MNGCPRDEIQVKMENFIVWYEGDANKIAFRQQVKKELPELEEKLKTIKDKYYSPEEVTKREQIEFKEKYLEITKSELRSNRLQNNLPLKMLNLDHSHFPNWDFQKRKRYLEFHDMEKKFKKGLKIHDFFKYQKQFII